MDEGRSRYFNLRSAQISLIITLLCLSRTGVAQSTYRLSGTVENVETGEVLPGVSMAILGTTRGVVTNAEGHFALQVPASTPQRIRITAIGYRPDTLSITLTADLVRTIKLSILPITGGTITITAADSRREAERIVTQAIAAKDVWQSKLSTYQFQVYARITLQTLNAADSNVLSVLESEANGYWSKEKGYGERIIARKQTANLPPQVNRISLLKVIDMYYDKIEVVDYNLPGPITHDPFTYYDYDLIGEGVINGVDCYQLSIAPRSTFIGGFTGTIWIGKAEYELAYVDLSLSDGVKLGPLTKSRIQETYALVSNTYYLPAELRFYVEAKVQLPFIPIFHLDHVSVMQNYVVNQPLPDSLMGKQRHHVAPGADSISAAAWKSVRSVPLTTKEEHAYAHLDSVARVTPDQEHFHPIGFILGTLINPNIIQYNRVEGVRIQPEVGFERIGDWPISFDGLASYGFNDKRFGYDATLTQALIWHTRKSFEASYSSSGDFSARREDRFEADLTAGFRLHDDRVRRGQAKGILMNTLTSVLYKSDFSDYYWGKGFDGLLTYHFNRENSVDLRYRSEAESSMYDSLVHFSVLRNSTPFRDNPPINDGKLTSMASTLLLENDWYKYTLYTRVLGEVASTKLGGDFNYTKIDLLFAFVARVGPWGESSVYLNLGAMPTGQPGIQHLFIFETPRGFANRARAFLTTRDREFQGDRIMQLYFEQNFYDLPTRVFGIHFLDRFQLHWFGLANVGYSSISDSTLAHLRIPVETMGGKPFVEAGFGLGNILNFLRVDFAWRLTHRRTDVSNFSVKETLDFTF